MGKSKHISNWKEYNQALVQRGSLTIWMDDHAIKQYSSWSAGAWLLLQRYRHRDSTHAQGRIQATSARPGGVYQLVVYAALVSPDYSCISRRANTVEVKDTVMKIDRELIEKLFGKTGRAIKYMLDTNQVPSWVSIVTRYSSWHT